MLWSLFLTFSILDQSIYNSLIYPIVIPCAMISLEDDRYPWNGSRTTSLGVKESTSELLLPACPGPSGCTTARSSWVS